MNRLRHGFNPFNYPISPVSRQLTHVQALRNRAVAGPARVQRQNATYPLKLSMVFFRLAIPAPSAAARRFNASF